MVVTLVFILFIALIFNMYIKLTCIIRIKFLSILSFIFSSFFSVLFLEFIIFSRFVVFFYLAIILLWFFSVNILHVSCLFFTNCNDYNFSTGSAFFRVHPDIDKDDALFERFMDTFCNLIFFLESLV